MDFDEVNVSHAQSQLLYVITLLCHSQHIPLICVRVFVCSKRNNRITESAGSITSQKENFIYNYIFVAAFMNHWYTLTHIHSYIIYITNTYSFASIYTHNEFVGIVYLIVWDTKSFWHKENVSKQEKCIDVPFINSIETNLYRYFEIWLCFGWKCCCLNCGAHIWILVHYSLLSICLLNVWLCACVCVCVARVQVLKTNWQKHFTVSKLAEDHCEQFAQFLIDYFECFFFHYDKKLRSSYIIHFYI